MKKFLPLIFWFLPVIALAQSPVIIDHKCVDFDRIPAEYIDKARGDLKIAYGHTSHGSQITTGMNAIEKYFDGGIYSWSHDGSGGSLHMFEGSGYQQGWLDHDCGYSGWADKTRDYLDNHSECNVIMWSWCGQVNDVDLQGLYLDPMEKLEEDYPDVVFIYMTGHVEGLGPDGSLRAANDKIRDFCSQNNKVLFDFADIERYDPDGEVDYQEYNVTDRCIYHTDAGQRNWATEWLNNNSDHLLAKISAECGNCAHSISLNCVMKGVAAWHMWARLAGWEGTNPVWIAAKGNPFVKISPNPASQVLKIEHNLNSEATEYKITDLRGRIMENSSGGIMPGQLDISSFESGIYFLKIKSNDKYIIRKFAVVR
jgi:hypothetical protein